MSAELNWNHRKSRTYKTHRQRRRRRSPVGILLILGVSLFLIFGVLHFSGSISSLLHLGSQDISAEVGRYAGAHGLDSSKYPEDLLELYARNPETKEFVLEYPEKKDEQPSIDLSQYRNASEVPLLMQWDQQWGYKQYSGNLFGLTGCGPTCLSMVAIYLSGTTEMNPAWMADFATEHGYVSEGNGSAWTLFSEGGKELGFDVTEIPLDEQRIVKNLKVGNPIVASMGKGDFTTTGHFIVMTGYTDGKIRVNDPNSRANSEKLWSYEDIKSQIKNLWVFR